MRRKDLGSEWRVRGTRTGGDNGQPQNYPGPSFRRVSGNKRTGAGIPPEEIACSLGNKKSSVAVEYDDASISGKGKGSKQTEPAPTVMIFSFNASHVLRHFA